MTAMTPDPLIGQVVGGRYEVLRQIGKGGAGTIYEVRNVRLGRSFALKAIDPQLASDPATLQRFRREADIVARIKHPNIVDVIDWDELPDGSPCLVMEYLVGQDLAQRARAAGALDWPTIARIGDQVLAALTITHASGVVHRDLKPQNIFLATDGAGDEQVKLLDFGVSKIRDSTSLVTLSSTLIGTPAYMAPEQAESKTELVGTYTDIWAMSVIIYELATGVRPFDGPTLPAMLYQVCHADPEPLVNHRPDAPAALVELLRDGLVRPVDQRLADAATMRERLRAALGDAGGGRVDRSTPGTGVRTGARAGNRPPTNPLALTAQLSDTLPNTAATAMSATPLAPAQRRARLVALVLGVLGIAAAAIVAVVVLGSGGADDHASRVASAGDTVRTDAAVAVAVQTPDAAVAAVLIDAAVVAPPIDAAVTSQIGRKHRPRRPANVAAQPPPKGDYIDNVGSALGRRMEELVACVNARPPDATVTTITATIAISAAGRATGVTFSPGSVDVSPLGGCLRTELMRVKYPTSDRDQRVSIPLRAKPAR